MYKYDIRGQNIESSLRYYKEGRTLISERLEGESDLHIMQNGQCVLDGLNKIIILKEQELNEYTQKKNLEEKK